MKCQTRVECEILFTPQSYEECSSLYIFAVSSLHWIYFHGSFKFLHGLLLTAYYSLEIRESDLRCEGLL